MNQKIKQNTKAIILGLVVAIGAGYASAWTGPTASPTAGNVPAPINIGDMLQTKSGILNLVHLNTSDLTVTNSDTSTTNIPSGSILVADGNNTGKVKWATTTSSVASGGGLNVMFVTPVDLVTGLGGNVDWTTISGLQNYGVPTNATAVILATTINGCDVNGYVTSIKERANSTGPAYSMASIETAGGGAPNLSNLNQGIYPISVLSGDVSFQYSTGNNVCGGSKITLHGYVTPGGGTTAVSPSGTVVGGCYANDTYHSNSGAITGFSWLTWGSANWDTTSFSKPYCNCPSNYTAQVSGVTNMTNGGVGSGLSGMYNSSYICVHN